MHKLEMIHTLPINETTDNLEIPDKEMLDKLFIEFKNMTNAEKNILFNMFAQKKEINPNNKTFKTIGSSASNILTARLKNKQTNDTILNDTINDQTTNDTINDQTTNDTINDQIIIDTINDQIIIDITNE